MKKLILFFLGVGIAIGFSVYAAPSITVVPDLQITNQATSTSPNRLYIDSTGKVFVGSYSTNGSFTTTTIAGLSSTDYILNGDGTITVATSSPKTITLVFLNPGFITATSTAFYPNTNPAGFVTATSTAFAASSTVSSQWTTTSTGIFYNGGNVGIGTTSPGAKLDVSSIAIIGSASGIGSLTIGNTLANSGSKLIMLGYLNTYKNWQIDNGLSNGGTFNITPSTANGGTTFTTPALSINTSGNVGIGTASPQTKLEIAGTASSTGIIVSRTATTTALSIGSLTGILKGTSGAVGTATNGTDYTLITANTCGANQHFSGITAAGVVTCSADFQPTINGSTYIGVSTSNGTSTITNNGVQSLTSANTLLNFSSATGTITATATTTPTYTSVGFSGDSTTQRTALRDYGFSFLNATTTTNFTHKYYFTAKTIKNLACDTKGGASVTLSASISATSSALGTDVMGGVTCTGAGFTTSTFSNTAIAANNYLIFNATSTNATTTLNVSFTLQDN